MFDALFRAFAQLFSPPLRGVLGLSLAIAAGVFAALWVLAALLLDHAGLGWWPPLHWAVELLGFAGVLMLTWLLFPAVVTMVMGCFLDRVAGAVETLDYPGRGPARRVAIRQTLAISLRLMLVTLALNLLALPVYLLLPGINLFVFLGLNGYLFGREYFEVVALRRLDGDAAMAMRHRFGGRVFFGGVVITGLFSVPLVNLAAPIIATAFMVHLFEGLPRLAPSGAAAGYGS